MTPKPSPPIQSQRGSLKQALDNGAQLLLRSPIGAEAQARTILRRDPNCAAAFRLLGKALRAQGHAIGGEEAELNAVFASRKLPAIDRAVRAIAANRLDIAEDLLRAFLNNDPEDAAASLLLGETLGKIGQFSEAEKLLRGVIDASQGFLDAKIALATLLEITARANEAILFADEVLARRPGHVSVLRFRAMLLANSSQHELALAEYAQLVEREPNVIAFWISYGDTLRTLGRKVDADAAYRNGLALDRKFGRSWWAIANLGSVPLTDDEMGEIERVLERETDPDNLYYLNFALGSAHAVMGNAGNAFAHFEAGNDIRRKMEPFDPGIIETEVRRSRKNLNRNFFDKRKDSGHAAADPIFIVGMPRSGSTLVEQVLASHPLVEGTAELPIIPILVQTMASDHQLTIGQSYRDLLPKVQPAKFAELGREYLRRAAQHRKTDSPFFIDKLPHNWSDIGFIHLILPNAKIIDVRRSPMDCCWSNFRLLFARGHPSSHSFEGMAAYYRHYVAMMDHFDHVLPGRVYRVIYDRLVDEFETEVSRLLDHLELPFDPACLTFYDNPRSVATASSEQVRRPLNREGIGTWRAYEQWLAPLRAALGPLASN